MERMIRRSSPGGAYRRTLVGGLASALILALLTPPPAALAYPRPGVTELASVASDGSEGDSNSQHPALSADGRYVAFSSAASNLVSGDTNESLDVFVHDRVTGETVRVSVASDGSEGDSHSQYPALSADGRYVAFSSFASNLVSGDTNHLRNPFAALGISDVFVHDRVTGETVRVSVASDGSEGDSHSQYPALSADGRYVAFSSRASNLVSGDTNGSLDVFVHDRVTGETVRVSVTSDGSQSVDRSEEDPAISGDGRYVAFEGTRFPGTAKPGRDVLLRDRGPETGVGRMMAVRAATERIVVSGWATFSGSTVASAQDLEADGFEPLGAEIVEASVVYRPEEEDLLLRLRLSSLPGPSVGGIPGVVYRWDIAVDGSAYEVRASRAGLTAAPPAAPYFALYDCSGPVCAEQARLSGGIGTVGSEVWIAVPVDDLGAPGEGAELTGMNASAGPGEAMPGTAETFDDVALPDVALPVARIDLGIAPAGTAEDQVTYTTQASLVEGRYLGSLSTASLPAGAYRVWARACVGETCGVHAVPVTF